MIAMKTDNTYNQYFIKREGVTQDGLRYFKFDDEIEILKADGKKDKCFSSGKLKKVNRKSNPERNMFCDSETETRYYLNNAEIPYSDFIKLEAKQKLAKKEIYKLEERTIPVLFQICCTYDKYNTYEFLMLEDKKQYFNRNSFTYTYEDTRLKSSKLLSCKMTYCKNVDELRDTFIKRIFEYTNKYKKSCRDNDKKQKTFVWFHNLKFDALQLNILELQKRHDLKLNAFNFKQPTFIHYSIDDKKDIVFIDSFNFYKYSLEKIGETFGIKKEKEKTKFEGDQTSRICDREFLEYSLMDIEILRVAIEELVNQTRKYGSMKMGAAGTAYNIFRTSFYDEQIYMHKNPELMYIERLAYYGGRTEIINRTGYFENVYGIDMNSIYPSMMYKELPTRYLISIKNPNMEEYKKLSQKYYTLSLVYVTDNNRILPHKVNHKTCFVNSKYAKIYVHQPELELLIESGATIEFLEVHCYEKTRVFEKFVSYFMDMKVSASERDDEVIKNFAKLMNNSCYGKTAERFIMSIIDEIDYEFTGDFSFTDIASTTNEPQQINVKCFGGVRVRDIQTNYDSANAFPILGGAITSYARATLFRALQVVGFENVIYCDTDSIYYEHEKVGDKIFNHINTIEDFRDDKINLNKSLVHEKGIWALEDKNINLIVHSCKDYLKLDKNGRQIKRKLKGISAKAEQLENDLYYFKHFLGMSEQLKRGVTDTQIIVPKFKKLERDYNKGETTHLFNGSKEYYKSIKKDTWETKKSIEEYKVVSIKPFTIGDV